MLKRENITAYALERVVSPHIASSTVYRLASTRKLSKIDVNSLAWIIYGLRELTGRAIDISDLLEYVEISDP